MAEGRWSTPAHGLALSNRHGSWGLLSNASQFHPKQQKQVNPENIHKVPIARGRVQGAPPQRKLVKFANHTTQPAQPAQHVQHMCSRENIEERTAGIRRQIKALRTQLMPRDVLANHEEQ